jgi:hypothetical protein
MELQRDPEVCPVFHSATYMFLPGLHGILDELPIFTQENRSSPGEGCISLTLPPNTRLSHIQYTRHAMPKIQDCHIGASATHNGRNPLS